jgi:hypothetical protein
MSIHPDCSSLPSITVQGWGLVWEMHVLKQQKLHSYIKIVIKREAENRTFSRIWTSINNMMRRSDSCKTANVSIQRRISSILQEVYLANALLSNSLAVQLAILRDGMQTIHKHQLRRDTPCFYVYRSRRGSNCTRLESDMENRAPNTKPVLK